MAKKHKRSRSGPSSSSKGPREIDPSEAKLSGPVTTFEDVADSEDEFYLNQDKIAFDEDPIAKRRRLNHDPGFDDPSDEEILDLDSVDEGSSDEDDDDEDEDEEEEVVNGTRRELSDDDLDDDEEGEEGEEDEYGEWGTGRKAYYNDNDDEDDDDEAQKLELEEVKRLQKKQLEAISAADFGVDEDYWKGSATAKTAAEDGDAMAGAGEVDDYSKPFTKKISIPETEDDKKELMRLLHPEYEHLKNEYLRLTPIHAEVQERAARSKSSGSLAKTKGAVLGAYMGLLCLYFAMLAQPRLEGTPVEIRDHSIMESLVKWRKMWLDVEGLEDEESEDEEEDDVSVDEVANGVEEMEVDEPEDVPMTNGIKKSKGKDKVVNGINENAINGTKEKKLKSKTNGVPEPSSKSKPKANGLSSKEAKRLAKSDAALEDLNDLLPTSTTRAKPTKQKALVQFKSDDFGDEDTIFEEDALENAKRKKSLKFYTAQIHQKSSKRAHAGRDAGGDMDVPHKERNKDKQDRLNAEAQKRGMAAAGDADDWGDDDEDGYDNDLTNLKRLKAEIEGTNAPEGDEDALAYYNKVAAKVKGDKLKKQLLQEAIKAAKEGERVVETETVDPETGKRAIGYTIEKNKGLTPHRKKDVRNPRVKKRKKYEEAKKKLGSKRAIYKAPTSAYGGESTGIRTKVVKSVKFS